MTFWGHIDRHNLLEEGWERNATYQWGIPLHPLGELNALDYIMQAKDDLLEMRARNAALCLQSVTSVINTCLFSRNFYLSARMAYQHPRVLAGWCCLVQAAAGIAFTLCSLSVFAIHGPPCRYALWFAGFGMATSAICVGTVLLQKAYLVHNRSKWLLATGIILLLPQPLLTYMIWSSPGIMAPVGGCILYYPPYLPWVKLAMDLPINIVFSVAFIMVVYRQYRRFGSSAWEHLMRNGIQTMCLVVFSNIFCTFAGAFELFQMLSEFFFIFDWSITSILLVHHCTTMRPQTAEQHRPRTINILHDLLQIKTAVTARIEAAFPRTTTLNVVANPTPVS
ncbi:hypothetical protein THASP1DRAFT_30880 [Thamnocephalis sphaerospora]|uniref:Uncharacterized protein n=1 Tax=Thamnocephalis sphaerospora TaxID=78915 RepID=A0A4P9XMY7_9FUNG|nr:hypothetical protein THASP1DRAFT_30880 [Thamnocephalis sphaerospora]|eukprot:RKP07307.1 hypothetical protein THASP1DRAFT_30880 [Thamnocephalis sphaerospora]